MGVTHNKEQVPTPSITSTPVQLPYVLFQNYKSNLIKSFLEFIIY